MNDRIIQFFRTRTAMGIAFLTTIVVMFLVVQWQTKSDAPPSRKVVAKLPLLKGGNGGMADAPVVEINPKFVPWRSSEGGQKSVKPPPVASTAAGPLPKLIHDFEAAEKKPTPTAKVPKVTPRSIPYGRLIQCQLIQPAACGNTPVPLIARIVRPVSDTKGRVWLPAGTRIHGSARKGELPGRLTSSGEWTAVLAGELVEVKGEVLDRDFDAKTRRFGQTDGTAGIVGTIVTPKQQGKGQVLMGQALSIAADASQDRMRTVLGEVELGSARTSVLKGASSLVTSLLPPKNQEPTLSYTYVAAGKEFYIYVVGSGGAGDHDGADQLDTMIRERSRLLHQLETTRKEPP